MMKIKIYFFGKPGDQLDLEKTYQKRINFNHQLDVVALSPAGLKSSEEAKKKEAALLLSKIDSNDYLVALDERGESMSSDDFSGFLMSQQLESTRLVLVIGGAQGLDQSVLDRANKKLSLGAMVWTKDLARLMLLEQVYRGFEILKGTNFHKA